jgi:hypothetical protein
VAKKRGSGVFVLVLTHIIIRRSSSPIEQCYANAPAIRGIAEPRRRRNFFILLRESARRGKARTCSFQHTYPVRDHFLLLIKDLVPKWRVMAANVFNETMKYLSWSPRHNLFFGNKRDHGGRASGHTRCLTGGERRAYGFRRLLLNNRTDASGSTGESESITATIAIIWY